uniref:Metallo-beta-lactamase domain-containing protein n=2 Tax=Biomphalaria glabrata TaxID=6526 RepID=A0A2C9M649_BIOGL
MAKDGSCLFKIGYFIYSRTRFGRYFHQNDIRKSKLKLGDGRHSELTQFDYESLSILPIPMVLDNYAYLVTDQKNHKSVLIDPGDAEAVQKVLKLKNVEPEAILVTHKHWDHSGGNSDLKQLFPRVPIYGSSLDNVPDCSHYISDSDVLTFGDLQFQTILTPGHTVGHTVFLLDGSRFGVSSHLFSGDCLFLGGCGRMFEAPPSVMLNSLDILMKLDNKTLMWPGHEYAMDNLKFAIFLDPNNTELQKKYNWVMERRENYLCTCPSTLEEEKSYNPFLRTSDKCILSAIGMIDTGDFHQTSNEERARALLLIRKCKDEFKYKL